MTSPPPAVTASAPSPAATASSTLALAVWIGVQLAVILIAAGRPDVPLAPPAERHALAAVAVWQVVLVAALFPVIPTTVVEVGAFAASSAVMSLVACHLAGGGGSAWMGVTAWTALLLVCAGAVRRRTPTPLVGVAHAGLLVVTLGYTAARYALAEFAGSFWPGGWVEIAWKTGQNGPLGEVDAAVPLLTMLAAGVWVVAMSSRGRRVG